MLTREFFDLLQPFIFTKTLEYLKNERSDDRMTGLLMAFALFMSVVAYSLFHEHGCDQGFKIGRSSQQVIQSMILKKKFKLTQASSKNFSDGAIHGVNGASWRFAGFAWECSGLITSPIKLVYCLYKLYTILGSTFIVGIALFLFLIKLDRKVHDSLSDKHHERHKVEKKLGELQQEVFENVKTIKFYGWDQKFLDKIIDLKSQSCDMDMQIHYSYFLLHFLWNILPELMGPLSFSLYIGFGNHLNLFKALEALVFFGKIHGPIHHMNHFRHQLVDLKISCMRIQSFLQLEEVDLDNIVRQNTDPKNEYAIKIDNQNFSWGLETMDINEHFHEMSKKMKGIDQAQEDLKLTKERIKEREEEKRKKKEELQKKRKMENVVVLRDIDLKIKKGEFVCIVGKVGSGKSSLLSAMIGDLLPISKQQIDSYCGAEGMEKTLSQLETEAIQADMIHNTFNKASPPIEVAGTLAYAQQTPWIQSKRIRDNIIYDQELDMPKYVDTIQFCELERDLKILNAGDFTEIGEKGVNLSGGQKARLGLARAVYQNRDIYLLDDPISALDVKVRKNIINNVINGMLKGKTTILVTHAIDFLHLADKVIIMDEGKINAQGHFNDLQENALLKELLETNKINKETVKEETAAKKEKKDDQSMDTPQKVDEQLENLSEGETSDSSKKSEEDVKDRDFPSTLSDKEKVQVFKKLGRISKENDGKILEDEETEKLEVKAETYTRLRHYYGDIGIIVAMNVMQFGVSQIHFSNNKLISTLGDQDFETQQSQYKEVIIKMGLFLMIKGIGAAAREYFKETMRFAQQKSVYGDSLSAILKGSVNKFFDVTPTGTIQKRFGEDKQAVENVLHCFNGLMHCAFSLFTCFRTIGETSWIPLLCLPFIIAYTYNVYTFSCHSYQEVHRLFGASEQPIGNHFSESLQGASTIRAYQAADYSIRKNHDLVNRHTLVGQVSIATWVWYSTQMRISASVAIFFITCYCMTLKGVVDASIIALSFTQIVNMGDLLTWFIHTVGHIEKNMISAQKFFKLLDVPKENFDQEPHKDASWPQKGAIEIQNVEARYREKTELVLKGLNLNIEGGSKIGVVGRTGAGKSTLSLVLLRILELESGKIKVDGVDISKVSLRQLRDKITIIPQEPTLFKGTLRYNLDPLEQSTDEEVLEVLNKSGLVEIINKKKKEQKEKKEKEAKEKGEEKSDEQKKEDESLLSFHIDEKGGNLSSGEKAIICICRAIMKKSKIVILDEATANIDLVTENQIQKMIKECFQDCTMITIAHRLQTIVQSDKVLVMGNGKVKEFDHPQALMANPSSHFAKLIEEVTMEEERIKQEREEKEQKEAEEKKKELSAEE